MVGNAVSRSSPAIVGSKMYIGDWSSSTLIAVDINTGNKLWTSKLDDHHKAVLTMPPVVYNGVVYQGVSSRESKSGLDPNFPCCTFRGSASDATTTTSSSFAALCPETGEILWQVADKTDGFAWAALTVANGVLFASSTSGHM